MPLLDVGLAFGVMPGVVAAPGVNDWGAAPLDSPLVLELLPVVDFPQSHESDFELSSLVSSFLSHPDVLPDVEELELEELDDELLLLDDEELDDDELDELEELDDELVVLDVLGGSVLLPPQLSPLVSGSLVVSVPVDDVLPQPSSATVSSSPVSS